MARKARLNAARCLAIGSGLLDAIDVGPASAGGSMRVRSLDSLRGVAALVVVLHHCLLVYASRSPSPAFDLHPTPWSWLDQTPLRITTVGHSAVLVFFALSGFVLTLALGGRPQTYLQFALKRLARIWPPLAFAVSVSAILYMVVRPHPLPLSAWFADASWRDPPSLRLLFEHLILSDRQRWQGLDNVIWSLSPEVRMSLAFPLIVLLVRRAAWATAVAAVAISAVAALLAPFYAASWPFDPLTTLQYTYLFALGAVLATHRLRVTPAGPRRAAGGRAGRGGGGGGRSWSSPTRATPRSASSPAPRRSFSSRYASPMRAWIACWSRPCPNGWGGFPTAST